MLPNQVSNLVAQPGNAQILLTWNTVASASVGYNVYRSEDGLTFTLLDASLPNANPSFLDDTVTNGTRYYYYVKAVSADGEGSASSTVDDWPVQDGWMTLGQLRRQAKQRADMTNSQFLTDYEWNKNINDSLCELYDLILSCFGQDYYVPEPYELTTTPNQNRYTLPPQFYKGLGVDSAVTPSNDAYLTLKRFNFMARNRYVFPQMGSTFLGVASLRYRFVGNTLMLIPAPVSGTTLRIWYVPRPVKLLQDSDMFDGFSGWLEYVIVDAAIKALQKEESDVTVLAAQKQAMTERLNTMADNRDLGEPETVTDARSALGFGAPNGDGGYAGY